MNNYLLTCENEKVRVNMYEAEAKKCAEALSKRHGGRPVKIDKIHGHYSDFRL